MPEWDISSLGRMGWGLDGLGKFFRRRCNRPWGHFLTLWVILGKCVSHDSASNERSRIICEWFCSEFWCASFQMGLHQMTRVASDDKSSIR